jgi:hypothetical protein
VFLAYASVHGHALIDRELYLPQSWTEDRARCREAGIPGETQFASKPRLAELFGQGVCDDCEPVRSPAVVAWNGLTFSGT